MGFLGKYVLATCKAPWTVNLGFCSTHVMCNRQSRIILASDGYHQAAEIMEHYRRELDLGVCWPDSGWGSVHHFYHAKKGGGLPGVAAADVMGERYFRKALLLWQRGSCKKAMFYLGAVTHLLQDVCQPHHAICSWGIWHSRYERWVQKQGEEFRVYNSGIYINNYEPAVWMKYCAARSYELFDLVNKNAGPNYYREATEHLLPFTQRVTAGLWLNFLHRAGVLPLSRPVYFNEKIS